METRLEFSDKLAALIYLHYRDRIRRLQATLEEINPDCVRRDFGLAAGVALLSEFAEWEEDELTEEFWERVEPEISRRALDIAKNPWAMEIEALLNHPVDDTPLVRMDYEVARSFALLTIVEEDYEEEGAYYEAVNLKMIAYVETFKGQLLERSKRGRG